MALIPPIFLDCVVAIGIHRQDATMAWVGTGFLYGRFLGLDGEGKRLHNIFLVTNKHVLQGHSSICIRFNTVGNEPANDYPVALIKEGGEPIWTPHPDSFIDVAALSIDVKLLKAEKRRYNYFQSDIYVRSVEDMRQDETTEGDPIFVLGFPMGIVSADRQYVICRSGCIARIRDLLDGQGKDFLIDAAVFPGNSGGPVITQPELTYINGTKQNTRANLIGMVQSYVSYQDVAVSQQTKRPRVIFEENSGLTSAIPVDYIQETVEICFRETFPERQISRQEEDATKAPEAQPLPEIPTSEQAEPMKDGA